MFMLAVIICVLRSTLGRSIEEGVDLTVLTSERKVNGLAKRQGGCGVNEEWVSRIPDCEPTCEKWTQIPPQVGCTGTDVTACYCLTGLLRDDDESCVPLNECGCYTDEYHMAGDVWTSSDCTQEHTCLVTPAHTVQTTTLSGCDDTTEVCEFNADDYVCNCGPEFEPISPPDGACGCSDQTREPRQGILECEPRCEVFIQTPPPTVTCSVISVPGCYCQSGLLLDADGSCIPFSECGCFDDDGYHMIGEVWTSSECTQIHTCVASTTINTVDLTACSATNEVCQLVDGDYACVCRPGYVEATPAGDCIIDPSIETIECGISDNCHVNADCTDVAGTFFCRCKSGFTGDGRTCTDIPACDDPRRNACSNDAYCINTGNGYACSCKSGFTGTGVICRDIIECNVTDTCDENADCNDILGTYECQCKRGFRGNGHSCEDVEECGLAKYICDKNAECFDCGGSYQCKCIDGFYGDGYTCSTDVDYGQYGDSRTARRHMKGKPHHGRNKLHRKLAIINHIRM